MQYSQEQYSDIVTHSLTVELPDLYMSWPIKSYPFISWYKYCKWLSSPQTYGSPFVPKNVQAVFASVFLLDETLGLDLKKVLQISGCYNVLWNMSLISAKQYVIELLWVIAGRSWGHFCWPNLYKPFTVRWTFSKPFLDIDWGTGFDSWKPLIFSTFHISFLAQALFAPLFFEGFISECIQQWLRPQIPLPCSYLWENEISMASPATVVEGGACTRFDSCVRASAMWLGMRIWRVCWDPTFPIVYTWGACQSPSFYEGNPINLHEQRCCSVLAGSMIYIRIYIYVILYPYVCLMVSG